MSESLMSKREITKGNSLAFFLVPSRSESMQRETEREREKKSCSRTYHITQQYRPKRRPRSDHHRRRPRSDGPPNHHTFGREGVARVCTRAPPQTNSYPSRLCDRPACASPWLRGCEKWGARTGERNRGGGSLRSTLVIITIAVEYCIVSVGVRLVRRESQEAEIVP